MSIALIVTRGFGNGTLVGNIASVVTRGYTIGSAVAAVPIPPSRGNWNLDEDPRRKLKSVKTVVQAHREQKERKQAKLLTLTTKRSESLRKAEEIGLKPVFPPLDAKLDAVTREIAKLVRGQVEQEALTQLLEIQKQELAQEREIELLLLLCLVAA